MTIIIKFLIVFLLAFPAGRGNCFGINDRGEIHVYLGDIVKDSSEKDKKILYTYNIFNAALQRNINKEDKKIESIKLKQGKGWISEYIHNPIGEYHFMLTENYETILYKEFSDKYDYIKQLIEKINTQGMSDVEEINYQKVSNLFDNFSSIFAIAEEIKKTWSNLRQEIMSDWRSSQSDSISKLEAIINDISSTLSDMKQDADDNAKTINTFLKRRESIRDNMSMRMQQELAEGTIKIVNDIKKMNSKVKINNQKISDLKKEIGIIKDIKLTKHKIYQEKIKEVAIRSLDKKELISGKLSVSLHLNNKGSKPVTPFHVLNSDQLSFYLPIPSDKIGEKFPKHHIMIKHSSNCFEEIKEKTIHELQMNNILELPLKPIAVRLKFQIKALNNIVRDKINHKKIKIVGNIDTSSKGDKSISPHEKFTQIFITQDTKIVGIEGFNFDDKEVKFDHLCTVTPKEYLVTLCPAKVLILVMLPELDMNRDFYRVHKANYIKNFSSRGNIYKELKDISLSLDSKYKEIDIIYLNTSQNDSTSSHFMPISLLQNVLDNDISKEAHMPEKSIKNMINIQELLRNFILKFVQSNSCPSEFNIHVIAPPVTLTAADVDKIPPNLHITVWELLTANSGINPRESNAKDNNINFKTAIKDLDELSNLLKKELN